MALTEVSLDDRYSLEKGRVLLSGTQALVRLVILQHQRDQKAGLNTAGYVSGYRGSPLGNVDREMLASDKYLKEHNIKFEPGVNEDLAATAIWGSQQVNLFPGGKYDGVFGLWYGKGPGVDRTGDVFRHGNLSGTSPKGGVLVVAGDDPACKSSTAYSQTEYAFVDVQIPVVAPANVQEFLDFGIYGYELSRFSGSWVAMKTVTENVESTCSVDVDPERVKIETPDDYEGPKDGVYTRWPDAPIAQEARLRQAKLPAIYAFARKNKIDHVAFGTDTGTFGIVTVGKTYTDVREALELLGITQEVAEQIGLGVYKVGMLWPLEPEGLKEFAKGLKEMLVIEEKRPILETQIKSELFNVPDTQRPLIIGKRDETDTEILSSIGELSPPAVAPVIAARLNKFFQSNNAVTENVNNGMASMNAKLRSPNLPAPKITRLPYFCSGCPHNTSTKVPEGSRAVAGIGCHFMAIWMNRSTATFTHMGGEGANWIGQAPFTEQKHVFSNLGDGTYHHSGLLAIRAAVTSNVNITYKILFNDAVAMTGGQAHDSHLTPMAISRQVHGEGVRRIAVVSDEPDKYPSNADFAPYTTFDHRRDLDKIQKELRDIEGVTVLIYDQTCAAEKRRRRKRGTFPDPAKRLFINDAVCDGCGDCGIVSNCVSLTPVDTPLGRKRAIDQSSCNKDYSCVDGFCPSFVTVYGGQLKKKAGTGNTAEKAGIPLPGAPTLPVIDKTYGIIITGIGGTGVVTIGAILGMAAHIEGKGVTTFDLTGLAQKNGPVVCHLKVANSPEDILSVPIGPGQADAIIGCDMVTTGNQEALSKMNSANTKAVVNAQQTMTAEFTGNKDMVFPDQELRDAIDASCGGGVDFINASQLATALLGDSIASNLFMVGFAWQKGMLPISEEAIMKSIELNGVAVDFNKRAFAWGRRTADTPEKVIEIVELPEADKDKEEPTLEEVISYRSDYLTQYQNQTYAKRYEAFVAKVNVVDAGKSELSKAVAHNLFKLMAYKDEYEVARLYTDPAFLEKIRDKFEGDYTISFNMAPPLLAAKDENTGHLLKKEFGPWMMKAFGILSKLKGLRGTALDIFGRTDERRMERQLITDYETLIEGLLKGLNDKNYDTAVQLASLPNDIRGFGHIKEGNVTVYKQKQGKLLNEFNNPTPQAQAAE
ncbi:MAG: indolepyruvate ferredoxin oxidoreductase family protein [Rhodospirillales bacterium]|nr:indolepyruvate ferredoxin oxidoreductase family protein [Rhodospirillales bacterium]